MRRLFYKSKYVYLQFIFAIFIFPLLPSLHAAEIRILFSSSLNGNLDRCTCSIVPVPGLAGRGNFIENYRKKYPDVVLVDTGDLVTDTKDIKKADAIYRSLELLKYDAVLPGDQDIDLAVNNLYLFSGKELFLASNILFYKPVFNTYYFPFSKEKVLNKNGKRITVLGVVHKSAFQFVSSSLKKFLKILPISKTVVEAAESDLLVVLSHGGFESDKEFAKSINRPLIMIGGHDQTKIQNGPGIKINKNVWYFQSGKDGSYLGEIILETLGKGKYDIKSQRLILMSSDNNDDHEKIRAIINELEKK